jgi:UDP-N-acetylglucosamine--N-acetylmuramyl-(pentapeptide) pyrophosphoryl-undecaprenol N-acetylglucosamine transferase
VSVRVLFAAGGTGGHVYPALAVAQALRAARPDAVAAFAGGRRGIEGRLVPAAGFALTRLPAAGLRGLGVWGAIRFASAFAIALVGAAVLVLRLRPDVVLATGGYASAAPAVAGAMLRRPLWLQEQNSVPGSTNRFLSRFAERAFVAFEEAKAPLSRARRVEQLPNPVRGEIVREQRVRPEPADYAHFGLQPDRKTVLVFGGSRGAATLNHAFGQAWPQIVSTTEWQALVQTGAQDWEDTRAVVERTDGASRARVLPYLEDMNRAYRVADLVVCRAGALTLAELAVLGKAAVLVPFAHATDDHQTRNAAAFARSGAAVVVPDAQLDGSRLLSLLQDLQESSRLQTMREAAARHNAGHDAAAELAQALIERAEGTDA